MPKRGSKSIEVEKLQEKLVSLGYKLKIDGHFGLLTAIVVKDFQRHAGLVADSIVGSKTKNALASFTSDTYCPEVFEPVTGLESAAWIESVLQKGLKDLGQAFYLAQLNNNVKWTHIVAHAILESAWGTSRIARGKNNLFGFKAYDSSPYASAGRFDSYEDCIYSWTNWFKKNYLTPGGKYFNGDSEFGVNVRYAISSIAGINKSFLVRELRQEIIDRIAANNDGTGIPTQGDIDNEATYPNEAFVSPHFRWSEFASPDGAPMPQEVKQNIISLCTKLEELRGYIGKPIIIKSGYRSPEWNKKVRGAKRSYHMKGMAADIRVSGIPVEAIAGSAKAVGGFNGMGLYYSKNFVHLDLRERPAKWVIR